MSTLSGWGGLPTGPVPTTWLASVLLGLIGLYIGAIPLAGELTTPLEAGLAAAGMTVFSVFMSIAYLEARTLDRLEGER
ncbi:hypothetical protein [Halorubrum sp. N11]|uniref:hypothetical protein n=1 Tax=Halorubrum sp. N11 TaxID=3402276 RepID=UPI003EBC96BA